MKSLGDWNLSVTVPKWNKHEELYLPVARTLSLDPQVFEHQLKTWLVKTSVYWEQSLALDLRAVFSTWFDSITDGDWEALQHIAHWQPTLISDSISI